MTKELGNQIAKRFIARQDVKAIQKRNQQGNIIYSPHGRWQDGKIVEYYPWDRKSLDLHLAGQESFGHYMLNPENNVKLFAFDIDLEEKGLLPTDSEWTNFVEYNPREVWHIRSAAHQRSWIKYQFHMIAHIFVRAIEAELGIPTAAAYSGNKGIHVYGFTGSMSASDARDGAMIVLDSLDRFEPKRGVNFFHDKNREDPENGFGNLSVELFPKQTEVDESGFGNLMRLPLGRNLKSPKDPTFFIDLTAPMASLTPVDPMWALTTSNPWKKPGE